MVCSPREVASPHFETRGAALSHPRWRTRADRFSVPIPKRRPLDRDTTVIALLQHTLLCRRSSRRRRFLPASGRTQDFRRKGELGSARTYYIAELGNRY